jgi:hypothetical protein
MVGGVCNVKDVRVGIILVACVSGDGLEMELASVLKDYLAPALLFSQLHYPLMTLTKTHDCIHGLRE